MKNMLTYNPPIWITAIIWHELGDKIGVVNLNKIDHLLNNKIALSNYGKGVEKLIFIFIAVQPGDTMHPEETNYIPNEKKLLLYRKLPFEKVEAYSVEEVLRLMADKLLDTIVNLWGQKIPDFNHFRLGQDIQKLFIDLGWVVSDDFYPVSRAPKVETVAAFLQSNGWKKASESPRYQVMTSPKNQPILKDKQLYLPIIPNGNHGKYERSWSDIILLLSKIYDIERLELELLFSKDKEQIERGVKLMQDLVAQV